MVEVKRKQLIIFISLLSVLLFKPAPGILLGLSTVNIISLLVMFIGFVLLVVGFINYNEWNSFTKFKENIKILLRDYAILFLLFSVLSTVISSIYGSIVVPEKTGITDIIESYRYVFYFIFYLVALNFNINTLQRVVKPFIALILIVEVFGILQFFNLFDINNNIGLLYTLSERHLFMFEEQHRIPSTFMNPNLYGSFLVIVVAILLARLSLYRNTVGSTLTTFSLLLLSFVSVFLTTSRTAVIVVAGVSVYWLIISLIRNRKGNLRRTFLSGLSVIIMYLAIAAIIVPNVSYLNYAAEQIFQNSNGSEEGKNSLESARESVESVSSFKNRYDYWKLNTEYFKESPILGLGPMKNEEINFADNSYLYILARYGIIGILIFAAFYVIVFFRTIKSIFKPNNESNLILSLAINLTFVGYLVMGILSEVWFNLQSMAFLFVLLGLLNNKTLNNKKTN